MLKHYANYIMKIIIKIKKKGYNKQLIVKYEKQDNINFCFINFKNFKIRFIELKF